MHILEAHIVIGSKCQQSSSPPSSALCFLTPDSVIGHVELRLLAETWHLELIELLLRYLEFLLKILENHVTFGHYVDLIQ